MYSDEIEKFLYERNNIVTPEECMRIMNSNESTQIKSIKHYANDGQYQIDTTDGYHFCFQVK